MKQCADLFLGDFVGCVDDFFGRTSAEYGRACPRLGQCPGVIGLKDQAAAIAMIGGHASTTTRHRVRSALTRPIVAVHTVARSSLMRTLMRPPGEIAGEQLGKVYAGRCV